MKRKRETVKRRLAFLGEPIQEPPSSPSSLVVETGEEDFSDIGDLSWAAEASEYDMLPSRPPVNDITPVFKVLYRFIFQKQIKH